MNYPEYYPVGCWQCHLLPLSPENITLATNQPRLLNAFLPSSALLLSPSCLIISPREVDNGIWIVVKRDIMLQNIGQTIVINNRQAFEDLSRKLLFNSTVRCSVHDPTQRWGCFSQEDYLSENMILLYFEFIIWHSMTTSLMILL